MARTRKIKLPDGREVEGTILTFRTTSEDFNEYLLDDGTVAKLKVVVTEVVRLDGEYGPDGNPLYFVASANVLAISAPDNLRKGGGT